MARLPVLMQVTDLRFTAADTLAFTLSWDQDADYANLIDHVQVRFMLTNLLDVGVDDDAVMAEMESWDDHVGSTATAISLPTGWTAGLVIHQLGQRYNITNQQRTNGEAELTLQHSDVRQRFARLIAQARTAD